MILRLTCSQYNLLPSIVQLIYNYRKEIRSCLIYAIEDRMGFGIELLNFNFCVWLIFQKCKSNFEYDTTEFDVIAKVCLSVL